MAQHKAARIVGVAVLLASVLTASITNAATSSHHRQARASMPERSFAADYAPAHASRYNRGMSAASQVTPGSGRGIFEEHLSAP
jgi:adenylosuccinate lyase